MKKTNSLTKAVTVALASASVVSLSSCGLFKNLFGNGGNSGNGDNQQTTDNLFFAFSIGLKSGASVISKSNMNEQVVVYDNGIDVSGRSYTFSSTDESIATIDQNGKITPKKAGRVSFKVKESKSNKQKALKKEILIVDDATAFTGGQNYSGGTTTPELQKRADILGALEKYAMDTHLTGITLFENGGYIRYSDRVKLPTEGKYVEGYGFGLLTEGSLEGTLNCKDGDPGKNFPDFYHTAMSQDPLKINQYTATGSQVSDLASYITSTYWGTRLKGKTEYEWYPCLATDEIYPVSFNASGTATVNTGAAKVKNNEPIPAEAPNPTGLYRKWRIYVKTNGDVNGSVLKYTTASTKLQGQGFNNRGVTIDDYEYIYQLLLTGSNSIIRGTEMANDSSYGIKGAQRYFNETKTLTDATAIQNKWDEFVNNDKLGIHKGSDENGKFLDIELINPIDSFTAMYTLSSSLVSPLPKDLFVGGKALFPKVKDAINNYGTFNNGDSNAILDYVLCVGPYTLKQWTKSPDVGSVVFERNNDWFEYDSSSSTTRYKIPGVYYQIIDTSTDTEKDWKQLEAGNLDAAGVPSTKTNDWKDRTDANVFPTQGDSTFKLNINSCTQEQWDKLFWTENKITHAQERWECKPWMSNSDFLDGLFYSINRQQFAEKRGVTPSTNYFANAYQMRNSTSGQSYNEYQAHKDAVKGYSEDYGYNKDKAIDCFRNAVKQLSSQGKLTLGSSKSNPTTINIHIRWMYQTDIKEYGDDIKAYIETAFNDDSVCGGKVKLVVQQDAVTNWEDVYNVYMMQGRFDLGFGAISGNTYNPLNFMEVLKSDNSSSFTLNWGPDTSVVDEKNPIVYDGKKWSFDALWEVADHGGIVENGQKVKPVKSLTANRPTKLDSSDRQEKMYEGFKVVLPAEFAESNVEGSKAEFDVNRLDIYVHGGSNITIADKESGTLVYNKTSKQITATVSAEKAQEVNNAIKNVLGTDVHPATDADKLWQNNPFLESKLNDLFNYEFYYELSINGGSASINYAEISNANE